MSDARSLSDPARLAALEATGLYHGKTEEAFDRFTRLVQRCLRVPVSLVSLVGSDRQRFPSHQGLPEPWCSLGETPLSHSFCQHVVATGAPLVVDDAREDPLVRDNAAIEDIGVVSYLGVPLQTPDGYVVGSLCAIDGSPRHWTDGDRETLEALAELVTDEMARRYAAARDLAGLAAGRAQAEARFRSLFDGISQLTGLLAADGAVLEANRTALEFAGLDRSDVVGQPLWDVLPLTPGMEARHRDAISRANAGEVVRYEETVWDCHGRRHVLDVRLSPAPEDPRWLLLEGRDVTTAARLRRVQTSMLAGQAGTWDIDLVAGQLINEGGIDELYGLEPTNGATRDVEDYFAAVHPDDIEDVRAAFDQAVEEVGDLSIEYRLLRPDGSLRWAQARGTVHEGGARFLGAVTDITERHREAEEATLTSAGLQLALDAAQMGRWEGGIESESIVLDARAAALHGLDSHGVRIPNDAVGEHIDDGDFRRVLAAYAAALEDGVRYDQEYRVRHPDGSVSWVRSIGDVVGEGRVAGIVLDVTDSKEAEATLRRSRRRLALALSAAQLGTFESYPTTGAHTSDSRALAILGLESDTSLADFFQRVHPDDRAAFEAFTTRSYAGTPGPIQHEYRLLHDAEIRWISATAWGRPDGDGIRVIGTVRDVTARKEAEAAIHASAERSALLVRLHTAWRTSQDPAGVLAVATGELARHLGVSRVGVWTLKDETLDFRISLPTTDGTLLPVPDALPATALGIGALAEIEAGRVVRAPCVADEPLVASSAFAEFGVESMLGVPIVRDGETVVGVYANHASPRTWTDAEIALVLEVGEQAWDAVERVQTQTALRESEARVRLATDAAGIGLWVWTPDGDLVSWENDRMFEIFGFDRDALPANAERFATEIVHPDDAAAFSQAVSDTVERGVPFEFEGRFYRADGALRWVRFTAHSVLEGESSVDHLLGTATDITDRVAANAALRESEARFRGTFENAAVGIAHIGLNGRWLRVNERLCEILGYSRQELLGRTSYDVTHPDDRELDVDLFDQVLTGETDHYQLEKRYVHRDGRTAWTQLTVAPDFDSDGGVKYVIAVVEDISDKKAAQSALRALNATLEDRVEERTAELTRSNEELDQFAYVASHDLKAPLRAIGSLATWIEEDAGNVLPEASARHLVLLRQRANRMEGLLDGLLTYSRVGRGESAPEPIDTEDVVRDVVALVEPPEGFDVRLEGDFPRITTSRAPLALVFRNLIGNAIKHHDRPDGCVTVRAEAGKRWATFIIEDDGPGIEVAYRERVFGLFQTLRPRDELEGSGMGLAIVKKTVEARGGQVSIGTGDAGGARFRFTWPLNLGIPRVV